jgi:hypothetical protein
VAIETITPPGRTRVARPVAAVAVIAARLTMASTGASSASARGVVV